ncbi:MAG: hypothetical protein R3Y56_08945 [Akkermansia sp.]
MKFQPTSLALLSISSLLLLSSCDEEKPDTSAANAAKIEAQASAQQEKDMQTAASSALGLLVSDILKKNSILQSAEQEPILSDPVVQPDGSVRFDVRIPFIFTSSLLTEKEVPAELDELRKAINDAANKAMLPDSGYLMQIGMPVEHMRDEDRQAKSLPSDLAQLESAMREQVLGPVYIPVRQAGEVLELSARLLIEPDKGQGVKVREVDFNEHQLDFLKGLLAESDLPTDVAPQILTPEWLAERKATIDACVAKFNEVAEPYIASREQAARALYVERLNVLEMAERSRQEEARKAELAKLAIVKHYEDILQSGLTFKGEWKRDANFGKISLAIAKAEMLEQSIHFVGTIYDTDMPEASLDVVGRCDLATPEEGVSIDINIYDGQYDPEAATAEVFDAQDGILQLKLNDKGQVEGVMTCASWKKLEGKEFTILMSAPVPEFVPAAAEAPAEEPTAEEPTAEEDAPDLP